MHAAGNVFFSTQPQQASHEWLSGLLNLDRAGMKNIILTCHLAELWQKRARHWKLLIAVADCQPRFHKNASAPLEVDPMHIYTGIYITYARNQSCDPGSHSIPHHMPYHPTTHGKYRVST